MFYAVDCGWWIRIWPHHCFCFGLCIINLYIWPQKSNNTIFLDELEPLVNITRNANTCPRSQVSVGRGGQAGLIWSFVRQGICQIIYTSRIPKFFNFTWEVRVNRDIFGKKMKMENILLIYFEQIVSFCTQIQA